ncbi:MAG: hypothetical protein LIO79_11090 [Rikenellaceae bacterium]|nr:hypothetical protein [Rikenellaceae bacterium]
MKKILFFSLISLFVLGACTDKDKELETLGEVSAALTWDAINGNRAMYVQRSIRHRISTEWQGWDSVLVSWRSFPGETTEFDVYKIAGTGNETKLNTVPIVNSTNYVDKPNFNLDNTYILKVAGTDTELDRYTLTTVKAAEPWITVPMVSATAPDPSYSYKIKDVAVGDLTGDGKYDIVVRRECDAFDIGDASRNRVSVGEAILEAYTMEGAFLWRVGLGPNIMQGEHTVPFLVYDLDGDGIAEVIVRTSELTTFGDGWQQPGQNYATASDIRALAAPEYLSVIDGRTGAMKAQTNYIPIGDQSTWTGFWGDNWGNRSGRYLMGIAYLDGSNPSIVMCRGYYKGTKIEAWDYRYGQLTNRWKFEASSYTGVNPTFEGQGNHQIFCADITGDGRDDIIYGAMSVSSYGQPIYSYGYGHGDCMLVGKFIKGSSGLQIWSCFESGATGASFRDGKGYEYFNVPGNGDIGRSLIANFDPNYNGYLMWAYNDNGAYYNTDGALVGYLGNTTSNWTRYMGAAIWWTGSLNRQFTWRNTLDAYNGAGWDRIQNFDPMGGATYLDKEVPLWYGDIFGDWREEIMFPSSDHNSIFIYSTPHATQYRVPYLMSDRTYRMSAMNQNVGYNQPTQTGFYMGPDMFN